jgi:glutathionylspermidine synthase
MNRQSCQPRSDFRKLIQSQGLVYEANADGSPYWDESAYYSFSAHEVDQLYAAAKELHQMFLAAAKHVLAQKDGLEKLEIPASLHGIIRKSWEDDAWEFYGRFDLTLNRMGVPKLIEYNADTPTGLLEAGIIQWYWKKDLFPHNDQFNSIHEGLVNRWKEIIAHRQLAKQLTHFTSVANHPEDRITVGYIARTAEEAGLQTQYVPIHRIGWSQKRSQFVDEQDRPINQIFKLYPWEWMGKEKFAPQLGATDWAILEPAWKAIFASKKLLLVMQELYPGHPNLLSVSDEPLRGDYVAKPAFGREGTNVVLYCGGLIADKREGRGDLGNTVYQEYCPLIQAKPGIFAQCGVWMAGPEPIGMGIREDTRPILGNTSHFVPHVMM